MSRLRLLKNGVEAFPAMHAAIDNARSSIALEMYIVADDETGREFREHLISAARRGVHVMVLIDAWGCWTLPDAFWDGLREAGGSIKWFRPVMRGLLPFRNHRKLLLIDNTTAYIGGINIADEYHRGSGGGPPWRDNVLEISGLEVRQLCRSFSRMWRRAARPLRPMLLLRQTARRRDAVPIPRSGVIFLESGPEDVFQPVRRAYAGVIRQAQKRIDLAMSYFFPPGRVMRALRKAVKRGVRVRLLLPAKSDVPIARWAARGLYGRLLRWGIEVWEYVPTMLHSKLTVADDTVIIGSANLDIRSGRLDYELVAVVADKGLAAEARADFEEDLRSSEPIRLEEWRRRPLIQKIKERISYWILARADLFVARMKIMRKRW